MKKRLLVVEDNFRLLQAINVCLTKAGFEVMTARDGDDALLRLAETIPDLIVSDIMMPGTDGFAFAANVRSNPRTDLIPIIFLTAKERREDRIAGFRAGVDAYLVTNDTLNRSDADNVHGHGLTNRHRLMAFYLRAHGGDVA